MAPEFFSSLLEIQALSRSRSIKMSARLRPNGANLRLLGWQPFTSPLTGSELVPNRRPCPWRGTTDCGGAPADGSLAFVWPFAMTRRYGVKTLSWLGQSYDGYFLGVYGPDVMPLLTRPVMSSLLRDITRERPDLAALHLLRMPLTWQGQGNPFARLTRQPFLPSYEMKLRKEFKELYEICFSGLSRNKIARGERKLAALGALIDLATSPEERLAVYETFKQQKAVQLAAAGQGNVFEDTAIDAFFTAVFSCTELRSFELDLSSLPVGPDIGATSIGARFKDRYYGMQTSLGDFEFKKLSPGFLLKRDAIARQCKCGASAFDLGPGAGWHKDSWHPSKLPRFATCIPLKPTGVLATALSIADLRARSAARSSRLVSKILGVAQSWQQELINQMSYLLQQQRSKPFT